MQQKKTVSNEARRNPKLTPKIHYAKAWRGIQVQNEVMLNILKSPESCIKPMRSADFSDTHWTTSQQIRNSTRLKEKEKSTHPSQSFCIFQYVGKSESETGKLVDLSITKSSLKSWNDKNKSEPEKFFHSENISPIKPRYLALSPEGPIWYKSTSGRFSLQHTPPLFYRSLSLPLSRSLFFKQLKSDYSSSQCDRDPHEALHH